MSSHIKISFKYYQSLVDKFYTVPYNIFKQIYGLKDFDNYYWYIQLKLNTSCTFFYFFCALEIH